MPDKKAIRAKEIAQAALAVFATSGYALASIEQIAQEAGIGKSTVYEYYKTKEEIYASINLKILESYDTGLDEILGRKSLSSDDKLDKAWLLLYDVFCGSPVSLRALAHGQLQGSLQNISPDLLETLNRTGRSILNKLATAFDEGIQTGDFRKGNTMALADLFWSTFAGVVYWQEAKRTTNPNKTFLKPMLDLAFEIIIRGIK